MDQPPPPPPPQPQAPPAPALLDISAALHLLPLIEFEPAYFAAPGRAAPESSTEADPAAWESYWRAALADAGIAGLTPLPGTFLVPAAHVTDPILTTLALRHLAAVCPGGAWTRATIDTFDLDRVAPLPGGYLIRSAAGDHLRPQTSGTLADLQTWADALHLPDGVTTVLAFGLPDLAARIAADHIHLTDTAGQYRFATTHTALAHAVTTARAQVESLRRRLAALLEHHTAPPLAHALADILVNAW